MHTLFGEAAPYRTRRLLGRSAHILRLCLWAALTVLAVGGLAAMIAGVWRFGRGGGFGQGGAAGESIQTVAETVAETDLSSPSETEAELPTAAVTEAEIADPETAPPDTEGGETDPPESSDGAAADTEPPADSDTEPAVPAGCHAIFSADMSRSDLGPAYVTGDTAGLPEAADGRLWSVEGASAVLLLHSHPYEGFGDGSSWYDPAAGSFAQTESAGASDGVVALGGELARALRELGVTVIQVRIAVSPEDGAADIYRRTESVVRTYCRLYPDIGLVLDLRRSAELTENGEILRTEGSLNGDPAAQLRISGNGGRDRDAVARELAVALALRAGLWEIRPNLSRPVRIKSGAGIAGDFTDVRVLTLELGSAGNTYAEAARLTAPLAAVLCGMLLDEE
jgi:stage II sporulation protein P